MTPVKIAVLSSLLALSVDVAVADTLQMPDASAASEKWNQPVPQKGLSKSQVEAKFGNPASRNGPTGTPPIYYWEYDAFTVYFEGDYVIHSVQKYKQPS
ncbi:hypothetical protein [Teredinibacter turnerae]|uniref:hypothetical protein n=1 Tax=Teredinibacter turnerae TaxID=2426 RepID=UPI000414F2A2|nr:hypothetical protein [Teredinibacter turnerae]